MAVIYPRNLYYPLHVLDSISHLETDKQVG